MALTRRPLPLFRALLAAHGQMMVNRTRRTLGRRGWLGLVGVIVILLAAATPLYVAAGVVGYHFGRAVGEPIVAPLMGGVLAVVTVGFGVVGGLLGSARQLTWDAYRSFPVPFRTLFFAETFASLADLVVLGFMGFLFSMAAAFVWERPTSIVFVTFLMTQLVLWMLFIQHLVGALAVTAARRLRRALLILVVAAWAGLSVIAGAARELRDDVQGVELEHMRALWHRAHPVIDLLPPVASVRGIVELLRHHYLRSMWLELPLLGGTLLLGASSYLLLRRETRPRTVTSDESASPDRRFRGAAGVRWTMARLHFVHIVGSLQGRFGLVVPLITVVLVKGPLGAAGIGPELTLPGSVIYLSLASTQFHFNQFGLDGAGAKTLFLLPVEMRDLLLGKTLALLAYSAGQNAVLLVLVGAIVRPSVPEVLAAGLLGTCLALAHVLEGHWISAAYPRPLAMHRMNSAGISIANLLPLGVGMLNGAVFGAIYGLVTWLRPAVRAPLLVVLLVLLVAVYRRLLPVAARFVDAHREKLVSTLG